VSNTEQTDTKPVEPQPEDAINTAAQAIARELVAGKQPATVVSELVGAGWAQDHASDFVHQVNSAIRSARRNAGKKQMWIGAAWVAGGVLVTVISYAAASKGGTYLLAWGAVIFGAYDMIRGLVTWMSNREPKPPSLLSR
jgi:hypothetical protein